MPYIWKCPTVETSGLVTYLDFVRSDNCFLYRPTESGFDITGDLTFGTWVYFDAESTNVETGIMGKWATAGNQRSYILYKSASNKITFSISDDGTTVYTVNDLGENYITGQWFFVVCKFISSTELAILVNGKWYRNAVGIPASIYISTPDFYVGCYNLLNHLDGRLAHMFLCVYAVPEYFICALYSHSKAMFMPETSYARVCVEVTLPTPP
jgi:hypothetical protein